MAIWITGDTHGYYNDFMKRIAENAAVFEGDTIIICGDFGFVWRHPEIRREYFKLRKEPFNFYFVDGNHEDFHLLSEYPVSNWNGGKAQIIEPNIVHLMRGEFYEIEGKTFFTMGGGFSRDRAMRQLGYTYFEEELPSAEEYAHADKTLLDEHNYKVDYILSHTGPYSIIKAMGFDADYEEMQLTGYLDKVKDSGVEFKHWFFGHFHQNKTLLGKYTVLLDKMIKLADKKEE